MRMSAPSPEHEGTMSSAPSPSRSRAPGAPPPRSLAAAWPPSAQVASVEPEKLSSSRLIALALRPNRVPLPSGPPCGTALTRKRRSHLAGGPGAIERLGEPECVLADGTRRAGAVRVGSVAVPLPGGPVVPVAADGRADPVRFDLEGSHATLGQARAPATLDVRGEVLGVGPDGLDLLRRQRIDRGLRLHVAALAHRDGLACSADRGSPDPAPAGSASGLVRRMAPAHRSSGRRPASRRAGFASPGPPRCSTR